MNRPSRMDPPPGGLRFASEPPGPWGPLGAIAAIIGLLLLVVLSGCVPGQIRDQAFQDARGLAQALHVILCNHFPERAPEGMCNRLPQPRSKVAAIAFAEERWRLICEPEPPEVFDGLCPAFRDALNNHATADQVKKEP